MRNKEWQYLFIPSKQVTENVSFENLAERFREKDFLKHHCKNKL